MSNKRKLEEQKIIQDIFRELKKSSLDHNKLNKIIYKIDTKFSNSYFLNFYVGRYFLMISNITEAKNRFFNCIKLESKFGEPYFNLSEIY
jgi:5-hydroxyisourate hydrolase-like protein (transthyretin family)